MLEWIRDTKVILSKGEALRQQGLTEWINILKERLVNMKEIGMSEIRITRIWD